MAKIASENGTWVITGMNLIPEDSIYKKLENAIAKGELEQTHLQKITGHLAPIHVDKKRQVIDFLSY